MLNAGLYLLQRISAMLMAPFVIVHLLTIIYAVQGGLDAGEILSRTRGSFFWGGFYGVFVLALAVHAAIGLRVIVFEWFGIKGGLLNLFTWLIGLLLLFTGLRAVWAVVLP